MKIANRDARQYVAQRTPFQGNNLYAQWEGDVYVVYSYGSHFPMYAYAEGVWFENEDGYSRTTSRHKGQARPSSKTVLLSAQWMQQLAFQGFRALAQLRILGRTV